MAVTVPWRTPAQIEAEVARLQTAITRARERAVEFAVTEIAEAGPRGDAYREAVARVTAATRSLVDFEADIPVLEEGYRRHVGARTMRWAGGLLAIEGLAGAAFAGLNALAFWWLFPAIALAAAGLVVLPGAERRAADLRLRPRLGALCFAFAGAFSVVCVTKLIPAPAVLPAFAGAWLGLRAFRVLGIWSAPGGTPSPPRRAGSRSRWPRWPTGACTGSTTRLRCSATNPAPACRGTAPSPTGDCVAGWDGWPIDRGD